MLTELNMSVQFTTSNGQTIKMEWVSGGTYKNSVEQIGATFELITPLNTVIPYDDNALGYLVKPIRSVITEGNKVNITYWYTGYPKINIFNGYVYKFVDGQPSTIICEDEKYMLRNGILNKTWNSSVSLKTILQYIISNTNLTLFKNNIDINFNSFWIENLSPYKALDKLKQDTGLLICIINNVLYCSLVPTSGNSTLDFSSNTNVYGCTIQQGEGTWKQFTVKVNRVDETGKKQVNFVTNVINGKTETYSVSKTAGSKGGMKIINPYKVDAATADKLAKNAIQKFKLGEYVGGLETMIYPDTTEFGVVNYKDITYPNRNGSYLILEKTVTINTDSGAKQKIRVSQVNNLIT